MATKIWEDGEILKNKLNAEGKKIANMVNVSHPINVTVYSSHL